MRRKNKNGFTRGMKRVFENYRWWDYFYMLDMEYEIWKHWLEVYSNEEKYHVCGDVPNRKLIAKIAISLLDIVNGNRGIIMQSNVYVNTKNANRFLNQTYIDSHIDNGEYDGYIYDDIYEAKAWHLYNRLREQYLRRMWD